MAMLVLSGERISELERVGSARSGDEFLISRHYNLSSDRLFSKRFQYEALVSSVTANLCAALSLSSAAFVEKCDYSRKNHGHDYSNVRVYTRYPDDSQGTERLASFQVRNCGAAETIDVFAPYQAYEDVDDTPDIGELKFVALSTVPEPDAYSDSFDGWVYPDGQEYSAADFPEAWAVYRESEDSETFRVPCLSSFFRLNPMIYSINAMRRVDGNNTAIPAHRHQMEKDIQASQCGKIKATILIPATEFAVEDKKKSDTDLLQKIHRGNDDTAKYDVQRSEYTISNIKQSDLTITGGACVSKGIAGCTNPSYNDINLMIYIGLRANQ